RRIARLLLRLGEREGRRESGRLVIPIPLTRVGVADLVDSTTPTVIRILAGWAQIGLVTMTRARITLKDEAALFRIAGWKAEDRERLS
ncbi:MAG: helix-turn-helix domain-containing protein, partial [Candidatus Methylomirabilis sp.]|nr:helix-turn-helix domain-containing protein [Deltaproteobacteria bacterium]